MIFPHTPQQRPIVRSGPPTRPAPARRMRRAVRSLTWLCLLAACAGASWFAIQFSLLPQTKTYTPDWHDASWVQASDASASVAYFRYQGMFTVLPDSAFVTVTASQVFRLYVNGIYIGSNTMDFVKGDTPQSYLFDVDAAMVPGLNAVGLRVANVDKGTPQVRATFGAMWGNQMHYYSTGNDWVATSQTVLAHPRQSLTMYDWSKPTFDAGFWQAAQRVAQPPPSPLLTVNPRVYEQPMPGYWLNVGSNGQEGYFVRQLQIPAGFDDALLRIVATGEADVFINDHLYMRWNGQVNAPVQNVVNYLGDNGQPAPYRNGLLLGVYDVSPFLHAGTNTIAVHVLTPGTTTAKVGLDTLKSALSLDMVVGGNGTYTNPVADNAGWHASVQPVDGWTHESSATSSWHAPVPVGRPGASRTFYLPDSNTPRNVQVMPPALVAEVALASTAAVLLCWLVMGLLALRRQYQSRRAALEAASLIFLPALALEALLVALSREPSLPQPFPYTMLWGLVLIALVLVSAILLSLHARKIAHARALAAASRDDTQTYAQLYRRRQRREQIQPPATFKQRLGHWLARNWGVIPIILLAIPLVCYNLAYEPYWQDELSSYYAARWIMTHGYPAFPSGFVYPKAELYSYLLAGLMSILGTTSAIVPRLLSVGWYLLSLPVLYAIGSKLFSRKVGWLATCMLALSPYVMVWSRETRMYEQAQFMLLVVLYVFYWALKHRDKILPVYIAVLCLIVAYFSHEEIFISLPAILFALLEGSRQGPYGFPAVMRKKHWWVAGLIASAIIATQLTLVIITHPPTFATDQSRRPQLQVAADNVPYYMNLLLTPRLPKEGPSPWVTVTPLLLINTLLALLGCVIAFCRHDKRARYCAWFLIISTLMLVFVFTMQADRYFYPLLPEYYLLGAYAFWNVLHALWGFARPYLCVPLHPRSIVRRGLPDPVRVVLQSTVVLLCLAVLLVPMLPLQNFNLFASRVTGVSYHEHYADYDDVGRYMHAHLQKGDIVISAAPAVIMYYYVGQVDYYFSVDRSLFLFEQNGQLVETTSGSHPLLNQLDFQTVLAKRGRIWLISDNGGYQGGVTKDGRFTFPPPDFRLVHEGYGSAIYFRSPDPGLNSTGS